MVTANILAITYLIASLSFRSAYIQPNVTDYEIKIGVGNKYSYCKFLSERENGKHYKGHDVRISAKDAFAKNINITLSSFFKEAYGINNQSADLGYMINSVLEAGLSCQYKNWANGKLLYFNKLSYKGFMGQLKTDGKTVDKMMEYRYKILMTSQFTIESVLIYKNIRGKEYKQFKMEAKYKL